MVADGKPCTQAQEAECVCVCVCVCAFACACVVIVHVCVSTGPQFLSLAVQVVWKGLGQPLMSVMAQISDHDSR